MRRRVAPDTYDAHLIDRLAGNVEALELMLVPTAAELYRANFVVCGDHELSLREALATVDQHKHFMHGLLGLAGSRSREVVTDAA